MVKRMGTIPEWSQPFAYAMGLIVSDGNLSSDGYHIVFTSKDLELVEKFKAALSLNVIIGKKARSKDGEKKYFRVQFGNKNLYEYLVSIGITRKKSLIISEVRIPKEYFWDFLRGCIDGDGNINVSYHTESKNPQLKVRLVSGSKAFLIWIHEVIKKNLKIKGGWIHLENRVFALVFAKQDGIIILKKIYKKPGKWYLCRKKLIADQFLV